MNALLFTLGCVAVVQVLANAGTIAGRRIKLTRIMARLRAADTGTDRGELPWTRYKR